jgi:hypothetical protein
MPCRIRLIAYSNTVMNKLLKIIFGILIILAFAYISVGQRIIRVPVRRMPMDRMNNRPVINNRPNQVRKMEVVKENYIGARLRLTSDQSKAFWPVWRQYVQDQTAVRILKRQNNSTASPDGTKQIDLELQYETELVNIRKHDRDEFLKILPPEKVSELYKSERDFNDEAIRILSESKPAGN